MRHCARSYLEHQEDAQRLKPAATNLRVILPKSVIDPGRSHRAVFEWLTNDRQACCPSPNRVAAVVRRSEKVLCLYYEIVWWTETLGIHWSYALHIFRDGR